MQLPIDGYSGYASGDKCDILTIRVHQADWMWVGLHPTDWDIMIVLEPSDGGLGGQDDLDAFPVSGHNIYLSKVNFFLPIYSAQVRSMSHKVV